jgi:hypothetical protein
MSVDRNCDLCTNLAPERSAKVAKVAQERQRGPDYSFSRFSGFSGTVSQTILANIVADRHPG